MTTFSLGIFKIRIAMWLLWTRFSHLSYNAPSTYSSMHFCIYYQSLFRVYSVKTGVLSWWIKPPECEFNNLPPFRTAVDIQWSHTSTLPIRLHTVNRAKRTFTFYCVPIYMHLYLQPVYDRNVPCTVQRIAFLITLPTITWVFITFVGLNKS